MNLMLRSALVATSLVGFVWVGCSEETQPSDDNGGDTTVSSTTSFGSTGPGSSTSTTVGPSGSTTTTTGAGPGTYECNPVTNEPCAAGEACDFSDSNSFVCFQPPNDQAACEPCDNGQAGPFCMGTMSCYGGDGICRKYCCDNTDCAPSLTCQKGGIEGFPDVGICTGDIGAGGGGAGGGPVAGCDDNPAAPATAGACIPFP